MEYIYILIAAVGMGTFFFPFVLYVAARAEREHEKLFEKAQKAHFNSLEHHKVIELEPSDEMLFM